MNKLLEKFKWTDKPELTRERALLCAIAGTIFIGFFKLRPYFQSSSTVVVHVERGEQAKPPKNFLEKMGLSSSSVQTNRAAQPSGEGHSYSADRSNQKSVIERPLFDGLEVTLRGTLLNSISSLATENPAEIRVTGFIPTEITQGMDDSEVMGAQLKGTVTANNNKKILNISFMQITTTEGRTFPITGYAIDLTNKTLGIAAEYSSGLPRRLLGAVLNRAIAAGDQIGMSALISGTTNDPAQAAIQMAATETNQQAVNELSKEATEELRNTQPELSVPAGTTIAFKIRVQQGGF